MTTEATPAESEEPELERILLVDDNPTNLQVLYHTLNGLGFKLLVAKSGDSAIKIARKLNPQLVLLDIMMPGIDGYETCRRLKADPRTSEAAVIFLSALDDTGAKIRGFELGAVDFITKPFHNEEVIARVTTHLTIDRLKRELKARNTALEHELKVTTEQMRDARDRVDGPLLGDSVAVRGLREAIAHYATSDETLLLSGPVNAGQEAVARAIHHQSPRARHAFIHVNCATLQGSGSAELLEATTDGDGVTDRLTLAEGGTLYLDGVHLIPGDVQERLLTLLAGHGEPASGESPPADVRLIVYTPQDLTQAAQSASFNLRLVEHLSRNELAVPSLAQRRDDIPVLAQHYAGQHARRLGTPFDSISDASLEQLTAYRWPGNIQELRSVIERAVINAGAPVIEVDQALLEEGLPLGHYRLQEKLGAGGMGEVWRARHQLLARPAAVKLIRAEAVAGANRQLAIDRFRREAAVIASLSSPNTIELYDFGISDSGSFYYVMELLEGMDVKALVSLCGTLPASRALMLLRQACRSLGEAHEAGLIHRDVKPANLFVCRLGPEHDVVKVLDFGIVKPVGEEAEDQAELTADNRILGTPAYLAPELLLRSKSVDARADIYSLGCVAYFMLSGRALFRGDAMTVAMQQVKNDPEPLSKAVQAGLPAGLERIVMACLEKQPKNRPASAAALWQSLGAIDPGEAWTQEHAEAWWRQHAPAAPDSESVPALPTLDSST